MSPYRRSKLFIVTLVLVSGLLIVTLGLLLKITHGTAEQFNTFLSILLALALSEIVLVSVCSMVQQQEIRERKRAEEEATRSREHLEALIKEHTAEFEQEILKHKQTERVLKDREQFIQHITQTIPGIIYVVDQREQQNIYINREIRQILGYTEAQIQAMKADLIPTLIHPDDLESMPRHHQKILEMHDGQFYDLEYRMRRADGTYCWLHGRETPFLRDADGSIRQTLGIALDITERKQAEEARRHSEERFRAVWEMSADAMVLSGPEGLVLDANPAYLRLYGYTRKEIVGRNFAIIFPEEQRQWAMQQYRTVFAVPDTPPAFEATIQRSDGSSRIVESRIGFLAHEDQRYAMLSSIRDVTDRKRVEDALIRERNNAQHYLDITPAIILALDHNGCITLLNAQGGRILHCEPHQVIGQNWFETFLPARVRTQVKEIFAHLMAGEHEPVQYAENWVITCDGEERIIQWHNSLIRDETGKIIGTLSSGEDITERKRAEEALRESEQRFKAIIQHAPLGIGIVDSVGNLIGCNQALAEMAGYTQEELLHLNFGDFTHPDDLEREWELIQEMWDQKSDSYRLEKRYVHKDGSIIWVDVVAAVVKEDGTLKLGFAFVQNVTERKQMQEALRKSEQKFRSVFQQSQEGIALIDQHARLIEWNVAMERMTGLKACEVLGQAIWDVQFQLGFEDQQTPEYYQQLKAMITEALQSGEAPWFGQYLEREYRDLHGGRRVMESLVFPIKAGNSILFGSITRDVTERKQLETQLKHSLHEKLVLLQEIHHRVKNNMQSIQSLLRLQYAKLNDPADRVVFEDVEQRIYAMAMIHEMLYQADDFARIDFSRYLQALIAGIWSTYGSNARRITPRLETEQVLLGVDVAIACGMLVNELVVNSLKHAFPDEREGEARVGLHKTGKTIELTVSDTGIGLPPDEELHASRTLGFTLIKGWISQIQGQWEIDRSAGTCFRITFREPIYKKRGAH